MSRRRRGERMELEAEINVVSLIDVMMLLMVIFMIPAPMMQGGVDVALPRAQARPLSSKSGLVVTVRRDGQVYVDDAPVSLAEFRASFKSLAERRGHHEDDEQHEHHVDVGHDVDLGHRAAPAGHLASAPAGAPGAAGCWRAPR